MNQEQKSRSQRVSEIPHPRKHSCPVRNESTTQLTLVTLGIGPKLILNRETRRTSANDTRKSGEGGGHRWLLSGCFIPDGITLVPSGPPPPFMKGVAVAYPAQFRYFSKSIWNK